MPDEQPDKIVKLLEEIRDLTKERNDKLEKALQNSQQRYEDALRRQGELKERATRQRRRYLWTTVPLLLIAIGICAYIGFWVIPREDARQWQQQVEQARIIQSGLSNYVSQPK